MSGNKVKGSLDTEKMPRTIMINTPINTVMGLLTLYALMVGLLIVKKSRPNGRSVYIHYIKMMATSQKFDIKKREALKLLPQS
jgi:hypothetical protein